jgi:hypothetical protein
MLWEWERLAEREREDQGVMHERDFPLWIKPAKELRCLKEEKGRSSIGDTM